MDLHDIFGKLLQHEITNQQYVCMLSTYQSYINNKLTKFSSEYMPKLLENNKN